MTRQIKHRPGKDFEPDPADVEAHIAWSVTAGYFETTQHTSPFFASLRPLFRKEMTDAAKAAKLKTHFFRSLANVQDDTTHTLLEALIAADPKKKDELILKAIQGLELPVPERCLR
jgi:hypothetical protein